MYSQELLNQKWIVYNTISTSQTGWNSFEDNYLLDFTNTNILKIKTLGVNSVHSIKYTFNEENRLISTEDGETLYTVLGLNKYNMVLETDNTLVYLSAINSNCNLTLLQAQDLIKETKWLENLYSIKFTSEKYLVANEIETKYNLFLEIEKNDEISKGAWLLDSYENILLLELYSERTIHKMIYQIQVLDKLEFKALSIDKNGKDLIMELYRK